MLLHGRVLRHPFLADDYLFLEEVRAGLRHAFMSLASYFRPLSREVYFWALLQVASVRRSPDVPGAAPRGPR